MSMSLRFASFGPLVLALLAAGCEAGGAPLAVSEDAASCPSPSVMASSAVDAGASSSQLPSTGLWMADGFVKDMNDAGFPGIRDGEFRVGDLFHGYVSYGMDIVTLGQSGTLAVAFGIDWTGPPNMLIVQGALAKLVWDGMTSPVVAEGDHATIHESRGGRIHCEQADWDQSRSMRLSRRRARRFSLVRPTPSLD